MTTNAQIAAAAEIVAAVATSVPRRKLTLVDEYGPFRGRPFFNASAAVQPITDDRDDLGRRLSARGELAWAAC